MRTSRSRSRVVIGVQMEKLVRGVCLLEMVLQISSLDDYYDVNNNIREPIDC